MRKILIIFCVIATSFNMTLVGDDGSAQKGVPRTANQPSDPHAGDPQNAQVDASDYGHGWDPSWDGAPPRGRGNFLRREDMFKDLFIYVTDKQKAEGSRTSKEVLKGLLLGGLSDQRDLQCWEEHSVWDSWGALREHNYFEFNAKPYLRETYRNGKPTGQKNLQITMPAGASIDVPVSLKEGGKELPFLIGSAKSGPPTKVKTTELTFHASKTPQKLNLGVQFTIKEKEEVDGGWFESISECYCFVRN
jgi:hypothetical protein